MKYSAVTAAARPASPPPHAMPMSAVSQIVAAVVSPWMASRRTMIRPAPRKPMPDTICAVTVESRSGVCWRPATTRSALWKQAA
jgi:hypothetical protein